MAPGRIFAVISPLVVRSDPGEAANAGGGEQQKSEKDTAKFDQGIVFPERELLREKSLRLFEKLSR
jgi:hypothetical protein